MGLLGLACINGSDSSASRGTLLFNRPGGCLLQGGFHILMALLLMLCAVQLHGCRTVLLKAPGQYDRSCDPFQHAFAGSSA